MRLFTLAFTLTSLLALSGTQAALAAGKEPSLPRPLEQLRLAGSQVFYLGRHGSMDGWVLIRAGKPEFYYAPQDGSALVMGILFDREGHMLSPKQVTDLKLDQQRDIGDMVGQTNQEQEPENQAQSAPAATQATASTTQGGAKLEDVANPLALATPAQILFSEVSQAPKVLWGDSNAPTIYAFIDPNCGHCHKFLEEIEPLVAAGTVAVNILPVGYSAASLKQAAFILASGDGIQRLLNYKNGDGEALPQADISTAAIDNNVAIQTKWDLRATPIIVYKTPNDDIRLIRGRPLNMDNMIKDLTGK